MGRPMFLDDFPRLGPVARGHVADGLSAAIDTVAARGAASHAFLRYGWYAAALGAYGGAARTLVVEEDGVPTLALPFVAAGPRGLGIASIPGSYWPFRSFALDQAAGSATLHEAMAVLARHVNVLRIGPVYDGDAAAAPLIDAARGAGWAVLDRFVADSWLLDIAARQGEGAWPRTSTLRKNRFHEKHLGAHGEPRWSFLGAGDWPAAFDTLASVEEASWIAARTDGSDAKFTATGHGAFWRAAAADPVVASMLRAALLTIDGRPAAFSFDIDAGDLKYAVANSYDPAYAKHSPGKLLYYRNLVEAVARGIARVDWGAGDSGYKQVIGADQGPAIRDWLLVRPGLPALLGRLARAAWRRSGQHR